MKRSHELEAAFASDDPECKLEPRTVFRECTPINGVSSDEGKNLADVCKRISDKWANDHRCDYIGLDLKDYRSRLFDCTGTTLVNCRTRDATDDVWETKYPPQ